MIPHLHDCPFDAVVFDLDGTLLDSAPQIALAVNAVLMQEGLAPLPLAAVQRMIGRGAAHLVEQAFGARGRWFNADAVAERTRSYLHLYKPLALAHINLFADTATVLAAIAERGVRLGLCTNKPEQLSCDILDRAGILPLFNVVLGGDSGYGLKPAPGPLVESCLRLGTAPRRVLFVGDSAMDHDTAHAVGTPFALIHHPGQPPSSGALSPHWRLSALREILDLLEPSPLATG